MKNDQRVKDGMVIGIAMLAAELQVVHDGTHSVAIMGTLMEELELADEMTELCELFHQIDAKLRASATRLAGGDLMRVLQGQHPVEASKRYIAEAPMAERQGPIDLMTEAEFFRSLQDGN